jgi:hypothetical protein
MGFFRSPLEPGGAMAFAKFLSSPSVAPVIKANGMEPYM